MILATTMAIPAEALNSADDILVPAVGRNKILWRTDMFVMNAGDQTVDVTVYWLERNQANPNPPSINFSLAPGETEVLDDVILNDFGFEVAFGAFRVVATGEVIVNTRVFATDGTVTYGQQSEGVPLWAATQEGQSTQVVGLTKSTAFRTNVYVQAGPDGVEIDFTLVDAAGTTIDTATLSLDELEPYLEPVQTLFSQATSFPYGTILASVTSGSAVIGASKVDNLTDDPTTLESRTATGGPIDGTYQIAIYESSLLAAGGRLIIEDGLVVQILGTYFNYDKVDNEFIAECPWILGMGDDYTAAGTSEPWQSFLPAAGGFTFDDTYIDDGDQSVIGKMTWTVEFEIDDNMNLTGTVDAVGSEWTGEDTGCNGAFPQLVLQGGKEN